MTDVTQALASETQFLWILFLTLFMILCFITVFSICHFCFCQRYLLCEWKFCGCCCHFDVEEYTRERRDLQRLREQRRNAELQVHLATFTQIPGPIPDSNGFRELQRQSAIRDLTSLGFIVVTPPSPSNSLQLARNRNQLTAQQRRDILKRLLACRTYHVESNELDEIQHGQKSDTDDDINVEEGINNSAAEQPSQQSAAVQQSYAFPLHEEPENPQKTCAICLDDFAEGELINDASKCRHVFHISCLVEWLDMHDACPCCRCTMITDTEWTFAATHANDDSELRTRGSERRQSGNLPETTLHADEENVVEATNESHDQEEEHTTVSSATNVESTAVSEPQPVTSG